MADVFLALELGSALFPPDFGVEGVLALAGAAGAGVVADSVPELEWKETINKARAIFRAVDLVS